MRLGGKLNLSGLVYIYSHRTAEARPNIAFIYLSIDFIGLRGHDEIILVQPFDDVSPPIDVLIARIPKNLVCRLSVNLVVDGNTKTRLPLLVGWVLWT